MNYQDKFSLDINNVNSTTCISTQLIPTYKEDLKNIDNIYTTSEHIINSENKHAIIKCTSTIDKPVSGIILNESRIDDFTHPLKNTSKLLLMKSDNNTLYTNTKQVLFTHLQNDNSSSKQTQNNCFDKQTFTNTSIIFNKYTQTETSYDKSHRLSMSSVNIVSIDPNENELICKNTCGSKYSQIDFSVSTLSNESNFQNKF